MKKAFAIIFSVTLSILVLVVHPAISDVSNGHLSRPNLERDKAMERPFGLGVIYPYPYFQKPRYRFPVYDRNGRGSLFYGYGGREVYQYTQFTPIEGHH